MDESFAVSEIKIIFAPLKNSKRYVDAAIIGGICCICHIDKLTPLGQQRRVAERSRWSRLECHSNAQRCPIFIADMMTQGFYQNTANNGFREYLSSSMSNLFVLDLSNCTLIECIDKMCEIKLRSHPNIRKNYRMLVNKLKNIEQIFGCTIMPAMISSVFWNHFIPYLAEQGLKYSTIGHVKANLIAVLNWSLKSYQGAS